MFVCLFEGADAQMSRLRCATPTMQQGFIYVMFVYSIAARIPPGRDWLLGVPASWHFEVLVGMVGLVGW